MKARSLTTSSMAAMLVAVAALASKAPGAPVLMAGDEKVLWIVRSSPDGKSYDVVAKPADLPWKWIDRNAGGRPASVGVVNGMLNLLFARPLNHALYDSDKRAPIRRKRPEHPLWPRDAAPIALCNAGDVPGTEAPSPTIIAVVPRDIAYPTGATKPTTTPSPGGATAPAVSRPGEAGEQVRLGVFFRSGSTWSHLTDPPGAFVLGPKGRLFAAAVGRTLFILAGGPRNQQTHLLAFRQGTWRQIARTGWDERSEPIAMMSIGGRLVIVLSAPMPQAAEGEATQRELRLAIYDDSEEKFSFQPVTVGGEAGAWDRARIPQAAAFTGRVALLWEEPKKPEEEGGRFKFAICGLDGRIAAINEMDVFTRQPPDTSGPEIIEVFVWALVIAILIPMLFMRPRVPPRPFSLPPTMRPANPFKRLLAGLFDMFPWGMISFRAFGVSPLTYQRMQEIVEQRAFPGDLAYAFVASLLLYTAYGIIMERKFGATLGKMIFKMRVTGDAGTPPGTREILLRNLVRIVELIWPGLPLLLVLPLFTRWRQRLGDLMARTAVIDTTFVPPPEESHADTSGDETHAGEDGETAEWRSHDEK